MSFTRNLLVLLLGAITLFTLVWTDVLPGGWRLRGWVTPHAIRQARQWAEHSVQRRMIFATEQPSPEGAVVFLGSSTMERFPLDTAFPGVPCLDRGIGNESLPRLLERLPESLPEARPAGAVLYLGSIDFRAQGRAPEHISSLASLAVNWIRERHPDLPLVILGILPEREMEPEALNRLARTNSALARMCEEEDCTFLPTSRPPITDGEGSLNAEVAADQLHLNARGYAALTEWLQQDDGPVGAALRGE